MPFTVSISKDNNISRYDPVSKSVVNRPSFYYKDLTGCDTPTHQVYSFNSNFNSVADCAPPAPAFNISVSSKTLNGKNIAMYAPYLLSYMETGTTTAIATLFGETVEDIGSSYRINTLDSPNGISVSLSKIKTETSTDPCGTSLSTSQSASLSVSKKDPNTCIVTLEEAISISNIITTSYKGVATPFTDPALTALTAASNFDSMVNVAVADLAAVMSLFETTYALPTTLTF